MMNGMCGGCGNCELCSPPGYNIGMGMNMGPTGFDGNLPCGLVDQISQIFGNYGCGNYACGNYPTCTPPMCMGSPIPCSTLQPCYNMRCSCCNVEDKDRSVYAMSYEHPTKDNSNYPRNGLCDESPFISPPLKKDIGGQTPLQSPNRLELSCPNFNNIPE